MADYRFAWRGSGMGRVWFDAYLDSGHHQLEYVGERMLDPYYQRLHQPDVWEREIIPMVHVLRFADQRQVLTPEVLAAFNRWYQADHQAFLAKLRADPEKYGEVNEAADPLLKAPPILRGANWVVDHFVIFDAPALVEG